MRRALRGTTIGVLLAAAAVVFPASASAAAPPTAPYTAAILDGRAGSYLLKGTLTFDPNDSIFPGGGSEWGVGMYHQRNDGSHLWYTSFRAIGERFVAGQTYPVARAMPDPGDVELDTGGDGRGCNQQNGTMLVREAVYDEVEKKYTAFAASVRAGCEATAPDAIAMEYRWNSSIGYTGVDVDVAQWNFGEQPIGANGSAKTITFTGKGSEPTTFGAASIGGGNAFVITGNTCSGTSVSYGQTCTVTVTAKATAVGEQAGHLVINDNTIGGNKFVQLSLSGIVPQKVSASPSSIDFGSIPIEGYTVTTVVVSVTGSHNTLFGTASFVGDNPEIFRTGGDTCSGELFGDSVATSCYIHVVADISSRGHFTATLQLPSNAPGSPLLVPLSADGPPDVKGRYYPLSPSRILDTRDGNGAPSGEVGGFQTVPLQVLGRGGVPASGVNAVVLNVTVTEAGQAGHVAVYPGGEPKPTSSSLNYVSGWTGANSVTVKVGADGKVNLAVTGGPLHLIADIVGFYAANNDPQTMYGNGGRVVIHEPVRVFDSREDWGEKLPGGEWVKVAVGYNSTTTAHLKALIVNVTVTGTSGPGHVSTWNGIGYPPGTSTLNFEANKTVPNFAIVPSVRCDWNPCSGQYPMMGVFSNQTTHVIVDVVGFIDDGTLGYGLLFEPKSPTRIVDSRTGFGIPGAIGQGQTATVTTPGSVADPASVFALALNVTGIQPTVDTNMIVWENGIPKPTVSNLNPAAGQIIPNAVISGISEEGKFNFYNHGGTIHTVVDVVGTFYFDGVSLMAARGFTVGKPFAAAPTDSWFARAR
ncbi:choice-of-anchor D domain-containing protein [Catelliglobosispora koreensis]|uniref:choice-of-anchor D domain-containing protein n=1 Tax=Catelliglobosispora koreensis TaxID=129052 RepID=UPI0003AA6D3B|nr:choice-of-anchor D domain-containing protein [Catelliglobosispora koreensis]